MGKGINTAKSFAEEGLDDLNNEAVEAEASLPKSEPLKASDFEDGFKEAGSFEQVEYFLRFNAPKKPTTSPYKVLVQGTTILGRFERSFNTSHPKYGDKTTYLVRQQDNNKLVALPSCAAIESKFKNFVVGTLVKITYNGMEEIQKGPRAGTEAHSFSILFKVPE